MSHRVSGIEVTPEQKQSFRNNGCLYIPRALAKSTVQPVKTHILNELKRLNIWSAGRALSQKLKGVPVFQQTGKLSQLINYPGLSERLISKELHAIMCQLAGAPLAAQDVQLLISLPHKLNWTIVSAKPTTPSQEPHSKATMLLFAQRFAR